MNLQPVILCGGSGTRLWPLSREQYPKQLLALTGADTLLQATARRLDKSLAGAGSKVLAPIVVANEDYRFITAEQLRQAAVVPAAIVLEPVGRNTAPALTLAALVALQGGGDPVLVVMPADHVITDVEAFRAVVQHAAVHAEAGKVVTFGIRPTSPETGYGYIRAGQALPGQDLSRDISAFVEKPDTATAARYVSSGEHFWNSGIFVMRASVWISQLGATRPDIVQACRAAFSARTPDRDFLRVGKEVFAACPADSIDYAVMEKLPAGLGVVIPLDAGWSDVGAWDALWHLGDKDADSNVLQGDVMAVATRDTLAISHSRLVTLVGVTETVVVETPDAVLVAHKSQMQQVKDLVARLKREGRTEADSHRKIHRPWGYYDSVDAGNRFQVKRIVVNPGAALSLQMHHHRAEHWVVVRGTARVTRGEEAFLVSENESTYIPIGTRHRLENPGKVPLEIIEVQSGAYLGEDDITRFDDAYGRS
ncbi:MAG: mannose-1-phosphate guanylyltransferase/mannose-6-phosphate isomerase [Gammaproteobacteria bacterium]|nr:mannose-1-phosphate guanylyltransferase/mannose-6-phosphate isomerase [Gammaproteobacteria bacterium]